MKTFSCDYQEMIAYSQDKANKVVLAELEFSRSTLWCLLPGQHIHPHEHAGDHVWTVLEGTGQFLSDEQPLPLAPGTVVAVPAGKSHGVRNDGEQGLVFLSISAG